MSAAEPLPENDAAGTASHASLARETKYGPEGYLKNGGVPRAFTAEDRRKGQLAQAKKKRELAMGIQERLARKLDERLDQMLDAAVKAAEAGDWRAWQAMYEQVCGRPAQAITGAEGGPLELEVSAVRERFVEQLEAIRERSET